ncbi:MAG TPA: hypothetical protein ENN73_03775, partial [Firmicutes bacterium]|nr:hypothetical protein [Bacillota bacterium]
YRVLKYDSEGNYITSMLQTGAIDKKIYTDRSDKIYLITQPTSTTRDVVVYSSDGTHYKTFRPFQMPNSIAIDTNTDTEAVYIYDKSDKNIYVYDSDLKPVKSFSYGYSYNVYDMQISNDGNLLLLTDDGGTYNYCSIVKINLNGALISKTKVAENIQPWNLIQDANDDIHIIYNHKSNGKGYILKLDSNLSPISTIQVRNGESNGNRFWMRTNSTRDRIVLIDHSSYKIDEYDLDYNLINEFIAWPGRDTGFHGLRGMKFDSQGNYWMTDELNKRIVKYDINSNFLLDVGHYYSSQPEKYFSNPYGIDVDSAGNVYVVDKGSGTSTDYTGIKKYDSSGNFIEKIGSYSADLNIQPGKLNNPTGVAVDSQGNIYIADWGHHRIQKYDTDSDSWTIINSSIGGSLKNPRNLDIDSDGTLYVVDEGNNRIVIFKNDISTAEWKFGTRQPLDVKVDKDDNIYVGFKRVLGSPLVYKYNKTRELIASFGDTDYVGQGIGIGFHPDGRVFMAEGDKIKIYKFRYPSSGGEIILRYDSGIEVTQWKNINWSSAVPENTSLTFRTRTADTEGDLASTVWSNPYSESGDTVTSNPGRYIEVNIIFQSDTTNSLSPVLYQLNVSYARGIQELWSKTYNNSIPTGGSWNINENIGTLNYLGQLYLKGKLTTSDNKVIGEEIYPFSITDQELGISFDTNKDIYKPGETINITGEISNLSAVNKTGIVVEFKKDEEIFYTNTFNVPAGSSVTFSTSTSSAYPISITGIVFESAGGTEINEFSISKQIDIQEPSAQMTVLAPAVVGKDSFDYLIKIKNTGSVDIDQTLNVGSNSESFILLPEAEKVFKYQYTIIEDTEITAELTGDVSASEIKQILFGENADIN